MDFPVYRSLNNSQVIYQINSDNDFFEIKRTGKFYSINHYVANQYPEKLRIRDMIINSENTFMNLNKIQFDELKFNWENNLNKIDF
jgi:hypothetical protein